MAKEHGVPVSLKAKLWGQVNCFWGNGTLPAAEAQEKILNFFDFCLDENAKFVNYLNQLT